MNDNLPPLPEPFCNAHEDAGSYWPDTFSAAQMQAYARAAIERHNVPAGYVPVPNSLIDEFPEINPSNYGHDDACALNRWGCEVVTAALAAEPQQQPVLSPPVPPEVVACLHAYGDSRADDDGLSGLRIAEAIVALRRWAAAAKAAEPQPQPVHEPVAAQHRFRHPQKTMPDWSRWQPCKVADRPAWQLDSQGYEVEYRALYTSPQIQREKQ